MPHVLVVVPRAQPISVRAFNHLVELVEQPYSQLVTMSREKVRRERGPPYPGHAWLGG
jgi:hypothetical protein